MLEDEPEKKDAKGKKIVKKKKRNPFKGYVDNNTVTKIRFVLEFEDGYLEDMETIKLEKMCLLAICICIIIMERLHVIIL